MPCVKHRFCLPRLTQSMLSLTNRRGTPSVDTQFVGETFRDNPDQGYNGVSEWPNDKVRWTTDYPKRPFRPAGPSIEDFVQNIYPFSPTQKDVLRCIYLRRRDWNLWPKSNSPKIAKIANSSRNNPKDTKRKGKVWNSRYSRAISRKKRKR